MPRNDKHPNIVADRLAVLKVFLQASDGVLLFLYIISYSIPFQFLNINAECAAKDALFLEISCKTV